MMREREREKEREREREVWKKRGESLCLCFRMMPPTRFNKSIKSIYI